MRPLLLDLFCGAGGAAMGYHRAGFDVVGVDIIAQPHYPFAFVQGDATDPPVRLEAFDAIHASPPCQAFSSATPSSARHLHPDLVEPTRALLASFDGPTVIENVVGAPVRPDLVLCGSMFGLPIRRHRLFELEGVFIMSGGCAGHDYRPLGITGVLATTHRQIYKRHRKASMVEARQILGLGHDVPLRGVTNAIPAAYTEFIGRHLMDAIT